ncbi:hypothetical protein BX661DRAFT_136476, partial [Kickxella alabastrina]|uniref:uncharacterized protein n=1 Tax=Kickxella alabastrina TaxID=61397 RepID=UPI00221E8AAF
LRDQFEWDLVTPEQVSRVLCAEKCLGGEFETAIAHAIREQLHAFVKSFLLAGYGQRVIQIDDRELARSVLPPVTKGVREKGMATTFEPLIAHL